MGLRRIRRNQKERYVFCEIDLAQNRRAEKLVPESVARIIVDRPKGLWNRAASAEHFSGLARQLSLQRQAHGQGRLLIDLSENLVQPQDAFAYVQSDFVAALKPLDKVAFSGGGALLRMQKKRLVLPADMKVFEKEADARSWLEEA